MVAACVGIGRCLHLFSSTGQYLARLAPGGGLRDACGVVSSLLYRQDGSILALDVEHGCVVQLDGNGDYLNTPLDRQHGLHKPQALALAPDGHLYVLDSGQVIVYDINEPRVRAPRVYATANNTGGLK